MLDSLFQQFENLIILDTETTGIQCATDEIIELAAVRLSCVDGHLRSEDEFDFLIHLSEGHHLPEQIVRLTGITEFQLLQQGVDKHVACERFMQLLCAPNSLVAAYNAQFDLCFLYYFLKRYGDASLLRQVKLLDVLSVYKDRRSYPHKLCDAVQAYSLQTQNTHRAVDDAKATVELLCAMQQERDDLSRYINLFGYNPRYGKPTPRISSVHYIPQPYQMRNKLYEQV